MTRINTNVPSLIAQNRLNRSNEDLQTSLTRLSTGLRINSGKDDPAGLIASESLRSDITGINKAISNTQRASQIIATADSALGEVSSLLNDIRGLVVEAANTGALSDDEIAANQLQVDSSLEAINRIAQTTTFQGRRLLDGSLDFITKGGSGFNSVTDLKIDQANLGASGKVGVDIKISSAATRAQVTNTGIPSDTTAVQSTGTVAFGTAEPAGEAVLGVGLDAAFTIGDSVSATIAVSGTAPGAEANGTVTLDSGLSFDLAVRDGSVADGAFGNDTIVEVTTNTSGTSSASFDLATNTLTLALNEGDDGTQVVADLAADTDFAAIFQASNGNTSVGADATLTLDSGAEFTLTAVNGSAVDGEIGNSVNIEMISVANGTASSGNYDANSNTLFISLEAGVATTQVVTDLLNDADVAALFTASGGDAGLTNATDAGTYGGEFANGTNGNVQASSAGTLTGVFENGTDPPTPGNITLTAVNGGAADGDKGNDTQVIFTSGASTAAAYDADANTLTVTMAAGATIAQAAAAINTDGTFTASNVTNGDSTYDTAFNGNKGDLQRTGGASITNVAAGTNDPAAGNFRLTAVNNGAADGTKANTTTLNFTLGAATAATYDADANVLNVVVAEGDTVQDVVDAINGDPDNTFIADNVQNGTSFFDTRTGADGGNIEVITPTVDLEGTDGTVNDVITVTADNATADEDGVTVVLTRDNSLQAGEARAEIDDDGNISVRVHTGPVQIGSIASAIDSLDGYGASVTTSDGDGSYTIGTAPVGGIPDPNADADPVINALAGGQFGGGLNAALVVELSGTLGSEALQFDKGASIDDVIQRINLVSDATGVSASNNSGTLQLNSTKYGSDSLVALDVISEGEGGTFESGLSSSRANGTDIEATVNGTRANGRGNTLSINTSTLDLEMTVTAGSTDDVKFDITGGGALFQLGPDVVSNQQARLGIGSLNTSKLGGAAGRLYELGTGGEKSLTNDISGAAEVVEEVINKVTNLRGRLGAFQATTLESNMVSLNDTVANLQQAESTIRDADFAAESAKLTRAQILVQSGTNVLALANQNPQNVLSLIR